MVAVGIDIGTSYCRIGACLENHQFVPVPNEDGQYHTPSYVAFGPYGRLVGEAAKEQAGTNPTNTFYNIKRLLSHTFGKDTELDARIRRLPFKIGDEYGKVVIEKDKAALQAGTQQLLQVHPKDLLAMMLAKLKKDAERHLRAPVNEAVISIPASLTSADRQMVHNAAIDAGLNVLRLTNEAVLAVIPCYLQVLLQKGEHVALMLDIGGGTVNVSLVVVDDGIFYVKATCGDDSFGGEDIDDCLVAHCIEMFRLNFGVDLTGQGRALRRLRSACERAKCQLTTEDQTYIEIDNLFDGRDLRAWINQAQLQEICRPMTSCIIGLIKQILRGTRYNKDKIHDILLVGGSSKIPAIQNEISQFLNGNQVTTSVEGIDMELATTYGAAIQASMLMGSVDEMVREVLVLDCTPKNISIEVIGGVSHVMVPRYTTLPVSKAKDFTTVHNNQQEIAIRLLEGDHIMSKDNSELEIYYIRIPSATAGIPCLQITVQVDASYRVSVIAAGVDGFPLTLEQGRLHTPLQPGWEIQPMPLTVPEPGVGQTNPPGPLESGSWVSLANQPMLSVQQRGDTWEEMDFEPTPPTLPVPHAGDSRINRPVPPVPQSLRNGNEPPLSYNAQVLQSLNNYQALMTDVEKMTSDEHLAHLLTVRDKNKFDQWITEMKEWLRLSKERAGDPY